MVICDWTSINAFLKDGDSRCKVYAVEFLHFENRNVQYSARCVEHRILPSALLENSDGYYSHRLIDEIQYIAHEIMES